MDYKLFNDDEVLYDIGQQFEKIRLHKKISDSDIMKKSGVSKDALWRFRTGKPVTTKNLIKILRGIDELDLLAKLFMPPETPFVPSEKIQKESNKRINNNKADSNDFTWGEDN